MIRNLKDKVFGVLGLFSSISTLICCALPAAIAALLGVGSLFTLIDTFPFLVTLSDYKGVIFLVAGALSVYNVYSLWFSVKVPVCPIDQEESCQSAKKFSKVLTIVSICIIIVGIVSSYL